MDYVLTGGTGSSSALDMLTELSLANLGQCPNGSDIGYHCSSFERSVFSFCVSVCRAFLLSS